MNREVIRCTHCRLVMFRGKRVKCPRCLAVLGFTPEMRVAAPLQPLPVIVAPATIGQRVRAIRKRAGASQRELGNRMGCSRTFISKIENGFTEPVAQTAARLAEALRCDIGELFPAFVGMPLGAFGDPELLDFMREMVSYIGMLTNEQWVAVRTCAKALAKEKGQRVVTITEVKSEAS